LILHDLGFFAIQQTFFTIGALSAQLDSGSTNLIARFFGTLLVYALSTIAANAMIVPITSYCCGYRIESDVPRRLWQRHLLAVVVIAGVLAGISKQ
jgi:hypothetical protein